MATNYRQSIIQQAFSSDPILDYSNAPFNAVAFVTSSRLLNADSSPTQISVAIDDGIQFCYILFNYTIGAGEVYDLCQNGDFNVLQGQSLIFDQASGFLEAVTSYFEITPW